MEYFIFLYIFLGILPSLAWLFYYLKKDIHPEPKKMIIKIFFWGSIITVPVFLIQIGLASILDIINLNEELEKIIYWFLIIAFVEEFLKFLVVRIKIIKSSQLDEPLDLMLYMVVSALGFAAVENILYLITPSGQLSIDEIITRALAIFSIRFIGSTFLHTLCSSIVGYFLAISVYKSKKGSFYTIIGIVFATIFHGFYNLSFIDLYNYNQLVIPVLILFILAITVFLGFERLKKFKGICKTN